MSSSNGVEKLENPPETQDNKASSEKAEDKTPKKATKGKKDKNDPTRFQGQGINFKAKMIGIEDVQDARGDKMCQEAMQKLKAAVKVAGEHKQRITINVSLDGLKIMDEKSASIIHHHAVHKISFISRDTTDARAFGYVYGQGDGTHQFFGIKTEKVAEGLVLTLRDLFQVVFEMKKQEVEEAKKKQEEEKENAENRKIEIIQEPAKPEDQRQNIYSFGEDGLTIFSKSSDDTVPSSNEPVEEKATEGKADGGGEGNLLDLENELFSIQQGIDQMSTFSPSATQGNGTTTPDPFDTTMAWGNTGSLASPASANSFQSSNSSQGFGALGAFPVSFPQQPQNDPFVTQPAAGLSPPVRTAAPSQANPFGGNAFVPRPTPGAGAAPAVAGFPTQQPAAPFGALPPQQQNTGGFGAFPAPGQQQAFPAPGQQQQQAFPAPGQQQQQAFPAPGQQQQQAFPAPGQQQQQAFPAPGQQQQQAFPAPGQQQALGDFGTFPPVTQAQPATSFNAFGSPQPAVQNQAAQPDPFKNDPFFSSTPAAGSQANQGDRYAAFGGMSQIQTDTSTSSSLFGDSSVFGSTPAAPAAPASISSANNAFAADPFQILSPTPTQPPLQQQPQQQAQEAPKTSESLFSDIDILGKGAGPFVEKSDFFKAPPKPSLNQLTQQSPPAPADPFGMSPPTQPATTVSNSCTTAEADPFDTSSVKVASLRGPFDTSFIQPQLAPSPPMPRPQTLLTCPAESSQDSPEEFNLPSPSEPPPPLPRQGTIDLPEEAPAPPPRPMLTSTASMSQPDSTQPVPRPRPRARPPLAKAPAMSQTSISNDAESDSQSIHSDQSQASSVQQDHIDSDLSSATSDTNVIDQSQQSTEHLSAKSITGQDSKNSIKDGTVKWILGSHTDSDSSEIGRTQSKSSWSDPFTVGASSDNESLNKDKSDPFSTESVSSNRDLPTDFNQKTDPFADSFPSNQIDPFTSPCDPFSAEFTDHSQLFTTKAVGVSSNPFGSDPFAGDSLDFHSDPFVSPTSTVKHKVGEELPLNPPSGDSSTVSGSAVETTTGTQVPNGTVRNIVDKNDFFSKPFEEFDFGCGSGPS